MILPSSNGTNIATLLTSPTFWFVSVLVAGVINVATNIIGSLLFPRADLWWRRRFDRALAKTIQDENDRQRSIGWLAKSDSERTIESVRTVGLSLAGVVIMCTGFLVLALAPNEVMEEAFGRYQGLIGVTFIFLGIAQYVKARLYDQFLQLAQMRNAIEARDRERAAERIDSERSQGPAVSE